MPSAPAGPRVLPEGARYAWAPVINFGVTYNRPAEIPNMEATGAAETAPRGESEAAPVDDLAEWFLAEYRAAVGLKGLEGGSRYQRWLKQFPSPDAAVQGHEYAISGSVRAQCFLDVKMVHPLGPDGYTCMVMEAAMGGGAKAGAKASAKASAKATHYAHAFWRRSAGEDPEYICVSPTFDSRDGEYRTPLVHYKPFREGCELLAAELSEYEAAVLKLVEDGTLVLNARVFPAERAEEVGKATEGSGSAGRLPLVAFAVALARDLVRTKDGFLMAHTNTEYVDILGRIGELLPDLARHSDTRLDEWRLLTRGTADFRAAMCGLKLVPLFELEATQPGDPRLAAWREQAVSSLVSDLALNFVSPSFAFYNQWTYVEGASASLFENAAMRARFERGMVVREAARSVREARRGLRGRDDRDTSVATDFAGDFRMKELDAQLYESVEYAQGFLLMSPVALMHTMEDVGWSLGSLALFVQRDPKPVSPAISEAFASLDSSAKNLFDYVYAAHCLHSRAGVVNTDLHSNNLTFHVWAAAFDDPEEGVFVPHYESPVVAYVAGPRGEADTYVFPAAGTSGCLIDYSRAILGPEFRAHGAPLPDAFYRDQVNRVMRALNRYAPGFVGQNQARLKAAVLSNYAAVFPVLCAVDFIAIGRSVASALSAPASALSAPASAPTAASAAASTTTAAAKRPFRVDPAGVALAQRLEREAQELFIAGLQDLAGGVAEPPAFPGGRLMESLFDPWRFPRWAAGHAKTSRLVDAYNYNNPLKYSGSDYSRYPPWARLDEIERHLGPHRLTDLFEQGTGAFMQALRPSSRAAAIAERLRAEHEALDGKPVATASSWIEA